MSEQIAASLIRALRRGVSYARLYGADHTLTMEACDEAARAANAFGPSYPGTLLAFVDETLFVDSSACGHTSLQFNGFLRAIEAAGVETLLFTANVEPAEINRLVQVIAGEIDEFGAGRNLRVNDVHLGTDDLDESPTSEFRKSYAASLEALRRVGAAVTGGEKLSIDGTADVVQDLLRQVVENPTAALLLATVKSHHEYTFYHSVNTSILSLGLAHLVGLPDEDTLLLGTAAMLHDIGKVGVSTAVLQHPGRLDAEQWKEIRRHPQIGAESILEAAGPGQEVTAVVAFEHHARFDGSGYPRLVYHDGTDHHHATSHPLHFFSRLVAVADTYDALTTRRSYRRAEPPSRALEILISEAGTSYDPDFVLAFAHLMGLHPPGSFLQLRSGVVVMVTDAPTMTGQPPPVVAIRSAAGALIAAPEPMAYRMEDVIGHVAPALIGITPAEVLEKTGIAA